MKRVLICILVFVLTGGIAGRQRYQKPLIDPRNLIGHWKMNDNAASAVVVDSTGNHNGEYQKTGAAQNTSTGASTGKINGALDFDGTNEHIEIADHNDFTFGDGTTDSPFSISVWVSRETLTKTFGVITKTISQTEEEWILSISSGVLEGQVNFTLLNPTSSPSNCIKAMTVERLSTGRWYHIVVTSNGSGLHQDLKIYIDGVAASITTQETGTYVAMGDTGGDVRIGLLLNSYYANGLIDNVMIFNIELTPAQIEWLYNSGYGIESLQLARYRTRYRF